MLLSEREQKIINDSEFLKTKLAVFSKFSSLFENVREKQKEVVSNSDYLFQPNIDVLNGKIFRGENYKSLPYLVLDHPKLYSKSDTFSFRTIFLWGNYFTSSIHIEGHSLNSFRSIIMNNITSLLDNEIYICINKTPWEYYFENDNYRILTKDNIDHIKDAKFLKLGKKLTLEKYYDLPNFSSGFLKTCLDLLTK